MGPPSAGKQFDASVPIMAEIVGPGDGSHRSQEWEPPRRKILWPLMLFVATCYSTYHVGSQVFQPYEYGGLMYAVAVMVILSAHELGHFFQTLRYKIHSSYPMFIPMPYSPLGTMGAVIGMAPNEGNRKALFDVAVSGPLAGLVPALICCVWGLQLSEVKQVIVMPGMRPPMFLGEPLLFQWLSHAIFGELPTGYDIHLHPIAFAGWVGLLITALNLFPIGQLDGGHTLYALLGKKAHTVARLVWFGCVVAIALTQNWGWILMLGLVWLMGTDHPPTADDSVPLGPARKIIGWGLLLFLPIGFTPTPFVFPEMNAPVQQQSQETPEFVRAHEARSSELAL